MISVEGKYIYVTIMDEAENEIKGKFECNEGNVEEAAQQYCNMQEGSEGEYVVCAVDNADLGKLLTNRGEVFVIEDISSEIAKRLKQLLNSYQTNMKGQNIVMHVVYSEKANISMVDVTNWLSEIRNVIGEETTLLPSVSYIHTEEDMVKISLWVS